MPSSVDDVYATWRRRLKDGAPGSTLIDLYELVAQARGLTAEQLTLQEREVLWTRALPEIFPGYEVIPDSGRTDPDPIRVMPYDAEWPSRFASWRQKLDGALGPTARRIDHVGSTSVPGMAAKDIIDIQVSVGDLEDEPAYVAAIESLRVQLRSRDDEHRYFRPFAGRPRDVHIHVCRSGSRWERRHVLFVEFLRESDEARDSYVRAKEAAARRWSDDRVAYTEAKTALISSLMDEAERWALETGWSVETMRDV
jgi:GrpB-like predicted nucleotidyltransferase (UPF0157 family)